MQDDTPNETPVGFSVQVTIDCADPHELAAWWAETLRWDVESQDEGLIRSMIEQGHATEADTRTYRGALVWRGGAAIVPTGGPGAGHVCRPRRQRVLRVTEWCLAPLRAGVRW